LTSLFNPDQVAGALRDVYGMGAAAVASALKDAGYAASEISSVLTSTFNETTAEIGSLLSSIGFSNSTIQSIGSAFSDFGSSVGHAFTSCFGLC
jgi:phage-related protein